MLRLIYQQILRPQNIILYLPQKQGQSTMTQKLWDKINERIKLNYSQIYTLIHTLKN